MGWEDQDFPSFPGTSYLPDKTDKNKVIPVSLPVRDFNSSKQQNIKAVWTRSSALGACDLSDFGLWNFQPHDNSFNRQYHPCSTDKEVWVKWNPGNRQ